jgi:hypothetical protein
MVCEALCSVGRMGFVSSLFFVFLTNNIFYLVGLLGNGNSKCCLS